MLKARGVTGRTAKELVESHAGPRVRAKIEVFDWLICNEDKRVGKNPAGYLVASIRSDYQTPGDYQSPPAVAELALEHARRASVEVDRKAQAEAQAQRDRSREAKLRAAWEQLDPIDREAILSDVKGRNPGLSRWKNMLEPLCLAALESRLRQGRVGASQPLLFPDAGSVD
jgi:hypothetical protein